MGTFTTFANSLDSFFGDTPFEPAHLKGHSNESTTIQKHSKRTVKYADQDKRLKYRTNIGERLTWTSRSNGAQKLNLLDCEEIYSIYEKKWSNNDGSKPRAIPGGFTRGVDQKWARSLIWVIGMDGTVYCNIPKIERFHHSSFTSGESVKSAGMWIVENGRLLEMAPLSGHYLPNMRQFMTGVVALKAAVKASQTSLLLYSVWDKERKSVPYDKWSTMTFADLARLYTPDSAVNPLTDDDDDSTGYVGYSSPDQPPSNGYDTSNMPPTYGYVVPNLGSLFGGPNYL